MVKVKICGITSPEDAFTAIEAGADALGFVFYSASPRHVSPEQAAAIIRGLPPFVQTVGLFVNEDSAIVNSIADQCGLDVIQLHGEETPEYCESIRRRILKAFRVKDITILDALPKYRVAGYLLDAWSPAAHGGTGQTCNWEIAAEAVHRGERIILAGGLTPENIAESIRQVRPFGVDVSSGVESAPGRKDASKLRRFVELAKLTP
ncbi:MAG: phosphoribosylanthranilate isomerase [Geobacteraceae bacterium]|nr:phosphoribosylanthranilate isomerase [Geobacteraceae bacterium]